MLHNLTISSYDIIHHLKLSCHVPDIVNAIASQKIIIDTAQKYAIAVTEEELQKEGDKLRLANKLVKAKDTWMWMEKHHLSLQNFEELVHTNVISRKLAQHLFANQVEAFFYQNQIEYTEVVTYEVVLNDRDLALELFYAVQEGEITFPDIARQYIENPEQRRTLGYQGSKHRNDFRPEIAAVVFAGTPQQILKPISTPKGVYLIWVEDIIQPTLNEEMRQKIIQDLFNTWLHQQVEINATKIQLLLAENLQSNDKILQSA
ncbi:peptidylprolyl isomerase [Brunnivagina elsteri]|uniref:peptidylprolyl isomerase n=1 Tax=Brunnivagina elsteri CCALA 953 TaxID=987040 RepID=A0A2A2TJZ2_9CYAN|nr:peptidylprolyl isomerase [Calothrix elsteri]PAX55878.1 peptidylprolyl isomerase [Calothrix elsteri CCALA 953]